MSRNRRAAISPYTTETVWNAGLAGTGAAGEGRSLTTGHEGDWTPEHLVLLAAESCFMSTLLALATESGIDVLGYVSSGHLHVPVDPMQPPALTLAPCVVVASADHATRVATLAADALRESVVARLLGNRLQVTLDVRAIPAAAPV